MNKFIDSDLSDKRKNINSKIQLFIKIYAFLVSIYIFAILITISSSNTDEEIITNKCLFQKVIYFVILFFLNNILFFILHCTFEYNSYLKKYDYFLLASGILYSLIELFICKCNNKLIYYGILINITNFCLFIVLLISFDLYYYKKNKKNNYNIKLGQV